MSRRTTHDAPFAFGLERVLDTSWRSRRLGDLLKPPTDLCFRRRTRTCKVSSST
jgi:hypothetical protein